MNAIDSILKQATSNPKTIVLPESADPRIVQACSLIAERQLARPVLVGNRDEVESIAQDRHINLTNITIVDPSSDSNRGHYVATLLEARKHKGLTEQQATQQINDPLIYAGCMVRSGDADGCVAGAANTTSDVVRMALQVVGMKEKGSMVSSFFLMQHDLPHQAIQGTVLFADCGLVIEPDASQLAQIAMQSAQSAQSLLGLSPRIALLSFSTAGSADHPNVDKVKQAGELIAAAKPDLEVMAEVQFDAAILPEVLKSKAPDIKVSAPANVFIFPDLQSGNIGYKIAQRLGGAQAIGPILQGLSQPVNDLSRGCSVDDIVKLVAVTSVQSTA